LNFYNVYIINNGYSLLKPTKNNDFKAQGRCSGRGEEGVVAGAEGAHKECRDALGVGLIGASPANARPGGFPNPPHSNLV